MGRDPDDDLHRTMPPNLDARSSTSKPLLFYKLMVASAIQDDKLKIPGKVLKRIEQDLSLVVTVSVPDGRRWNVKLEKDGGKCCFGDGWVDFMKYYSVRVGYLLVFRYKGDSVFVVNIFNLSNAEIHYLPDPVGGSERVSPEKQCSVSKGNSNQCGNGDAQKKLDSAEIKEEKPCLLIKGKRSGSEGSEKLENAHQDKLCSETNGTQSGNDGTQNMPHLGPQGSATVASQSQKISDIINKFLQSKLSELGSEVFLQIKNHKGDSEKVQLERLCTLNKSDKLTIKRPVSGMIRQEKQCLVNKGKESGIDATQQDSGSKTIEADSHTEPGSFDTLKKSNLPPPGPGKSSQQTPGTGCVLSPQSDKGVSTIGGVGVEKEMGPSSGAGSPSSFLLVKDVSPGYYRANITSLTKKKQPTTRKAKNPQSTDPGNGGSGFGAEKVELNSLGKKELTPGIHLSKTASNVPTTNSLTPTAKPEGTVISHTRTIADGGDKKLPQPDKLYSETQLPKMTMNIPPASQLSVQTPVKRKEINTADLLSNTAPITVLAGQKVNVSTADVLNSTSEKTAKVPKKRKTIQLSAISKTPINPYCMVPMRVSSVQKNTTLNIPSNFATKYLQEASSDATLQNPEGKQWKVRLISSNGSSKLSQGWYRFATDNNLKEGDMCIFELVDSVNTLLKVSITRSPKDPPPADQEVLKL